jgi:8-oxo-dGTP pyrophosphatase MutT (NUDIX family)
MDNGYVRKKQLRPVLLQEILRVVIRGTPCENSERLRWLARLPYDALTRDENPNRHFCIYFLPYNPITKQVFIVHHKKSDLWISPGGHIEEGEMLLETLNREMGEELGVKNGVQEGVKAFLLTISPIENPIQPCKEHFDIWYRIPTDGSDFNVDPAEFHETKWLSIPEARELVNDPANVAALDAMEVLFST